MEQSIFYAIITFLKIYYALSMKLVIRLLLQVAVLILILLIVGKVIVESWLKNNIPGTLNINKVLHQYSINIEKVHVSLLPLTIELKNISLFSKADTGNYLQLNGDLSSLKLRGISAIKVILKKDIEIDEIIVSGGRINGLIKNLKKEKSVILFPRTIKVRNIIFDKINLEVTIDSSARKYEVKEGVFAIYDVQVIEKDTFSFNSVKAIDFKAVELLSVSTDSMYTYKATNVNYSNDQKTLTLGDLFIQPNFSNYEFTARNKYQADRISVELNDIHIYNLDPVDFLNANLVSSFVQVGEMDMKLFSDKRRPFQPSLRSIFPEMIYEAPGKLNIDSLVLKNGAITYTERAGESLAEGSILFSNINASIFNISNNPIYKTKEDSLKIFINALLMGKSTLTVVLKSKIFDINNTLYVSGSLGRMDIQAFNPFLEKTELVHVNSGRINRLNFYFIANNYKSSGHLRLRYSDFAIAHMNTKKGLKAALTGMIFNILCNAKLLNENPMRGKGLRVGIIEYKRDPERFVINYLLKSVMSGIKSSLLKSPKKKKKIPPDQIVKEL